MRKGVRAALVRSRSVASGAVLSSLSRYEHVRTSEETVSPFRLDCSGGV
jgi:hypothetical protein